MKMEDAKLRHIYLYMLTNVRKVYMVVMPMQFVITLFLKSCKNYVLLNNNDRFIAYD